MSGIGTFCTIVRPRATSRCLTWSMTSHTSRTTWSPCNDTAPVSSPFRTRTRACCALVLTLTQMSANASEATNARTSRSISPLIAPASGPTSCCSRGRSVITPANTSLRIASTSTCCLDRVDDLRRDGVLHLRRVHQRADRVQVTLTVVQRPLPPERDRRRRRQQRRQHDTDHRRDRPPRASDAPERRSQQSAWVASRTLRASSVLRRATGAHGTSTQDPASSAPND